MTFYFTWNLLKLLSPILSLMILWPFRLCKNILLMLTKSFTKAVQKKRKEKKRKETMVSDTMPLAPDHLSHWFKCLIDTHLPMNISKVLLILTFGKNCDLDTNQRPLKPELIQNTCIIYDHLCEVILFYFKLYFLV